MFRFLPCNRLMVAAAFAAGLTGCAALRTAPVPEAAFVVLGEGGAPVARVITAGAACPAIEIDGARAPMQVRSPRAAIAPRGSGDAPAGAAVQVCEAALPAGAARVTVAGQALPLPAAVPKRIVVIGDTGCRIAATEVQDCNDPDAYPFARVAASAAAWRPDLVIHVGDYHYRERPCPGDRPGCAGSPWGYGWDAWNADFFAPARPLLAAAPWVMVRGNHENCARAGQGWWRFLDPHALALGRDCEARATGAANDVPGDHSDAYAVPLGDGTRLLVLDTANTSYKGFPPGDARLAAYRDLRGRLEALAQGARHAIAVGHHPLYAYGATRDDKSGDVRVFGGDAGLVQAFGATGATLLPANVDIMLSGHVHLWEQVSFASDHPTQFVSGFAGTAEETVPLPDTLPAEPPVPGARVDNMSSWFAGFGFMTMERVGDDAWTVAVHDRDGRVRNTCRVAGRRSRCEVAQVR
jgi:hypothetical protein